VEGACDEATIARIKKYKEENNVPINGYKEVRQPMLSCMNL
jgi:hypothetical protein